MTASVPQPRVSGPQREASAAGVAELTFPAQVGAASLGFWSAVVVAILTIAFVVANILAPAPPWHGMAAYVRDFSVAPLLWMLPAFALMPAFLVLMACIESYAPANRKLLARIAFGFTLLYAGVIGVNYYVQWMVVRPSILAGETDGLALLSLANPTGLLYALEGLAYLFQETALLFGAFVFVGPGLPRAIRWTFLAKCVSWLCGYPRDGAWIRVVHPGGDLDACVGGPARRVRRPPRGAVPWRVGRPPQQYMEGIP